LDFSPQTARRLREGDLDVVVTGGGGWIGQAALEMLDRCFGQAAPGRMHVFGSRARPLALRSGRTIACHELSALAALPPRPSLFVHCAFLTRDRIAEEGVDRFIAQNRAISGLVAEQARIWKPRGIFVPSSGAVYRADRSIDNDLAANPYGATKAEDERRFAELGAEFGSRTVVCRVFNLAGPFINKVSTFALKSILLDIARGGPVVLRAQRPVVRSYIHVRDLIELAFAMMLGDAALPEAPFDTAGEVEVELSDLARHAIAVLGRRDVEIVRPPVDPANPDRYVGDGAMFRALLARYGIAPADLDRQIIDTAEFLRQDFAA
jgi:nucleoside-diphosphate-sugar epimerase